MFVILLFVKASLDPARFSGGIVKEDRNTYSIKYTKTFSDFFDEVRNTFLKFSYPQFGKNLFGIVIWEKILGDRNMTIWGILQFGQFGHPAAADV